MSQRGSELVGYLILVRHAHSTANASGILSGQRKGVFLSESGREQAESLADRLGAVPIGQVLVSPMERCQETIEPWLTQFGNKRMKVAVEPRLIEVDYGAWSGKKLRSLATQKLWNTVQRTPSRVTFPGGESLLAMQQRAMSAIHDAFARPTKGHVMVVSHGDVIKSIVASSLGMHLDEFQRIVIDPASVSIIDFYTSRPRALVINNASGSVSALLADKAKNRILLGGGAGPMSARTRKKRS